MSTASIEWATTESLPLTSVQANGQQYARMSLYRGYPVKFRLQLPISAKPELAVEIDNSHPTLKGSVFPGGPIFKAVLVEMDAQGHDWIWLSATPK